MIQHSSCVVVEAPYGEVTVDMWQNCALCQKSKVKIILVFFYKLQVLCWLFTNSLLMIYAHLESVFIFQFSVLFQLTKHTTFNLLKCVLSITNAVQVCIIQHVSNCPVFERSYAAILEI